MRGIFDRGRTGDSPRPGRCLHAGSPVGIFLGAILLYTIEDVLLLRGIDSSYIRISIGVLIVLAVVFNNLARKTRN